MEYNIQLTEEFLEEIDEICNYISTILRAPNASKRLRKQIMNKILLLKKAPKIFSKIMNFDRTKRQYRRIVINNYVLLYTIHEKTKIIYISHIYYGGKNYINGGLL